MIDKRFSLTEFEKRGLDSNEARILAGELEETIRGDTHKIVAEYLAQVVKNLNSMEHDLKLEESTSGSPVHPVDLSYRDDWSDSEGYHCKLRLAITCVVSVGYSHLINTD